MMSRTSLANDAESASTARAASYPVTSQTRVPNRLAKRTTSPRSRVVASRATGSTPSRWSGNRMLDGTRRTYGTRRAVDSASLKAVPRNEEVM